MVKSIQHTIVGVNTIAHFVGTIPLVVAHTELGAGETIALVVSNVREVKGTMGRPLLSPDYVGTLFGGAAAPGAIGINYGTGMVLEPRFDVADGSYDADQLRGVLAHEVSHYWWNSKENWIDEGMAEFLRVSQGRRISLGDSAAAAFGVTLQGPELEAQR